MPTIHVLNTGQKVETDLVTSILVSLQRNAVPIMSVCGGRAQCGKCAVRIVKGLGNLTKRSAVEVIRLKAIEAEAGADVRLACQTHTRGDVEIEILNMAEAAP